MKIISSPLEFSITGTGKFLPRTIITSEDLDLKLGKSAGWTKNKSNISKRHFASRDETTSFMASKAASQALINAKIKPEDLDCIISACAGMEQAIPSTSSLISQKLGLENKGVTTFDINSTCLSFLSALDVASCMIASKRFKNILIVSSDIPSLSMNWKDTESCVIFGDGAAACIITEPSDTNQNIIKTLSSRFETYSAGIELCQIQSGGTKLHPSKSNEDYAKYSFFEMNGKSTYGTVARLMPNFIDKLFFNTNLKLSDIALVIPHQASQMSIRYLQDRLMIPKEKLLNIFSTHGNQVASSIPTALHEAFTTNRIKNGDKILIIGTSAGISIGGMVLEYNKTKNAE